MQPRAVGDALVAPVPVAALLAQPLACGLGCERIVVRVRVRGELVFLHLPPLLLRRRLELVLDRLLVHAGAGGPGRRNAGWFVDHVVPAPDVAGDPRPVRDGLFDRVADAVRQTRNAVGDAPFLQALAQAGVAGLRTR